MEQILSLYEAIIETLEVMSDPELMADVRQVIREADEGQGQPLDEVLEELGW
jgi:PHD/YefM family antitoxin component YafN of YafNO toxin-antitoxin module